jgi:hypothetical protein
VTGGSDYKAWWLCSACGRHWRATRAASKSSDRLLSLVDASKDGLRRGVDVVVLSGIPHRPITLTWAGDEC